MKSRINVGVPERWGSALGGAVLAAAGLRRMMEEERASGSFLTAVGAGLIWRGATGHCNVYEAAGIDTADHARNGTKARLRGDRGVNVDESVTVDRPAGELYHAWRNLEWLPRVIPHLASVEFLGDGRSQWVARGPGGKKVRWTAEIINEVPGRLLAWRTVGDPDLVSAGSVHFTPSIGNRGTIVRLRFQYDPPAGKVGSALAWLFGREPSQEAREGLRRFKQMMEAGELATNEMRPQGGGR
jgi:uncharacterized membrane protein